VATADDVAAVAAIEQLSFGDPWSPASFESLLGHPAVLFLVAVEGSARDEMVSGYVVTWYAADEAEVANLAVAPARRGTGVGAALLDAALRGAVARGAIRCFLEVRASNVAAQRLYFARGFEAVGRRKAYYRKPTEDALVLRCLLPAGPPPPLSPYADLVPPPA
jgi:ribosomal-protein-alanine N-acetyltransferase